MKKTLKGIEGFTLVEMTVVIAIIAVLAALTLPAVTGLTTDTRTTSKAGDLKEVEQAIVRFESDNPATLPSASALASLNVDVVDTNNDGQIDIFIGGVGDAPGGMDATCEAGSASAAVAQCFAPLQFSQLVPDYLKVAPQHSLASSVVTAALIDATGTLDGTASSSETDIDFRIANCNISGAECRFYVGATTTLDGLMSVWNVVSDGGAVGGAFAFAADEAYGIE